MAVSSRGLPENKASNNDISSTIDMTRPLSF
jgi:hypothetical protein